MFVEEKQLALSIKNASYGRFCNIKFQKFLGEHAPDPLGRSPFGEQVACRDLTSTRKFTLSARKFKLA